MAKDLNNDGDKLLENNNENKVLENSNDEGKNTTIENKGTDTSKTEENTIAKENNLVNNEIDTNQKKEETCKCCNDGCNCGDCNKCCDSNKCCNSNICDVQNKSCCSKKCSIILALAACIVSVLALNKVNKVCTVVNNNNNIAEKIQIEVKDAITKNPQLILDAISNGLVNKRDKIMEQSAVNVENNKNEIIKSAIRIGDATAKFVTICFFDPAGTPCMEAQRTIVDIVKQNNKKMCFYLLPVSVLGDKSEKLAKVYYQLQAFDMDKSKKSGKQSNKLGDFIQEIVKDGATVDKVLDIIKVNKHELNKYEDIAKSNLNKNKELLEKLKISSLPAIFISNQNNTDKKYEIINKHSLLSKLV
ncbi:MAG: hypothetical protein IJU54_02460 [Alphaproteobacteria bacterium]|nr:hypothetical protein [Alphaproteobacteria bacterium]